jgi:hypothetical protein
MSLDSAPRRTRSDPHTHLAVFTGLGWLVGSAAAVASLSQWIVPPGRLDAPGVEYILAPAAFGIGNAATLLIGELALRRRLGRIREVSLVERTIASITDRWLLVLFAVSLLFVVAVVALGAALSGSDGQSFAHGEAGSYRFPTSDVTVGIFPGPHYGVTMLVAVLAVVVTSAVVLQLIARRPALDDPDVDSYLRRLSAHRVLRAGSAALLVTGAGGGFLASVAVAEAFATGPWHVIGMIGAGASVAIATLGLVVLLLPCPRRSLPTPTALDEMDLRTADQA